VPRISGLDLAWIGCHLIDLDRIQKGSVVRENAGDRILEASPRLRDLQLEFGIEFRAGPFPCTDTIDHLGLNLGDTLTSLFCKPRQGRGIIAIFLASLEQLLNYADLLEEAC
jgi:hypothetical protein